MVIPSESSGPSFSCSQNALICEEGTTTSHIKTQLVPYVYMNKNKQQKLIKHYRILGTRLVLHWNDNDILMPKLFNTFFTSWFKKDHLKAWMCHLKMMRLASMLSRAVWLLPCQGINHHQNSKDSPSFLWDVVPNNYSKLISTNPGSLRAGWVSYDQWSGKTGS